MVDDADLAASRQTLRTSVQRMRGMADPAAIAEASRRAADVLTSLSGLQRARTVLVHRPVPGDLDPTVLVDRLAERGVRVLSFETRTRHDPPTSDGGTPTPLVPSVLATGRTRLADAGEGRVDDLALVEVVVVPGVAFDLDGGRLGPEDDPWPSLLERVGTAALRIGLARPSQLVPRVPRDPEDPADPVVDVVVTDRSAHHTGARLGPRDA